MPSIAVITDSDASLPPEVAERHGIRQVPITIHFGQEVLRTGIDIDDSRLFVRVAHEGKLPTTAAPSPGAFADAYEAAFVHGADAVLCLTVSSAVSAAFTAATAARDLYPDRPIRVIDTHTLTMAQGFMALAAAEAIREGASLDDAAACAEDTGLRSHVFGTLSTLKYLAMSGRVGHVAAGMAALLNVKPVLSVRDGKLEMLERVRTQARSLARIVELVREAARDTTVERLAIVHCDAPERAVELKGTLSRALTIPDDVLVAELTTGLAVHTGAGMVGVALVTGRR